MATAFPSCGVYACDACGTVAPTGAVLLETTIPPCRTYCPGCAPTYVPSVAYAEAMRRYRTAQEGTATAHVGCDIRQPPWAPCGASRIGGLDE